MKRKVITVGDLRDQINLDGAREFLLCRVCGQEASANRGDYFMAGPESKLICCGQPLLLVRRRVIYDEVAPGSFEPTGVSIRTF